MKLNTNILSQEDKRIIHRDSIYILENIGISYGSDKALLMLEKQGAKIDLERKIAKIPESLVEKCLDKAPKSFMLGARNPVHNVELPAKHTVYSLDGTGPFMIDLDTGEKREGLLKDNAQFLRVFEEMENGKVVWTPLVSSDVEDKKKNRAAWINNFKNSSKHIQGEVTEIEHAKTLIEILTTILGSVEEIKRRKIASVVYCPISPLSHEKEIIEANMELTKYGIPILIYPMSINGSTGPASIYSTISMCNAEILSGLVVFQLCMPGTPILMGTASAPMDFRTGVCNMATPEMALQAGGIAQMAKFYGLPCSVGGICSDTNEMCPQTILEKVVTTISHIMIGADIINGVGMFESSMTAALQQLVVDDEVFNICSRLTKGVDISPEKNCLSDIEKVGPRGHFLKSKSTKKISRTDEIYTSRILDKNPFDSWVDMGKPNMYDNAAKKIEEILLKEHPCPLPMEVIRKLDQIMEMSL